MLKLSNLLLIDGGTETKNIDIICLDLEILLVFFI